MNTIEDNNSDVALCNSDDNWQGLGKAANNLGVYILARAWRSRYRNIVQDIVQQMLRARTGRYAMNTIADNTSVKILYSGWAYVQLRSEAPNKMYSPKYCAEDVTSKDGAKLQIF